MCWGQTCVRAVDGPVNSGDLCVCSWITLCLSTYPLTWGFPSAIVCLVPGSARQPEPRDRVFRRGPSGRWRRKTLTAHEVGAAPDGARSHEFRGDERPGNRERRAAGRPLRRTGPTACRWSRAAGQRIEYRWGTPTAPEETFDPGVTGVGTGNRVSVNGATGQGTGNRTRAQLGDGGRATDQTEPGAPRFRATGGGASSNGTGQPATGPQTGIARRALEHDGRCDDRVEG